MKEQKSKSEYVCVSVRARVCMIVGVKRDGWLGRESMSEGAERARRRENVMEIGRKESRVTDCIYMCSDTERREGRVTERKSGRFNVCASVYLCEYMSPACVRESGT